MRVKKEDAVSEKKVLRKVGEQAISKPKAGASLEQAVRNVKKIFKKKRAEAEAAKKKKSFTKPKPKPKQFQVRELRDKGIVYIGHIPHGFYEKQIKNYFKQFGHVMRVRVARSKKTGKSRGYGYVEFLHPQVAEIAADTMNNYFMCSRLLKATYIPPEKQHSGFFSRTNWSENMYPRLKYKKETTLSRNRSQNADDYKRYIQSSLDKLSALESKLQAKGISIKFQPVEVPKT